VAPFDYSVIGDSSVMACEVWDRSRSRVLDLCRTEQPPVQLPAFEPPSRNSLPPRSSTKAIVCGAANAFTRPRRAGHRGSGRRTATEEARWMRRLWWPLDCLLKNHDGRIFSPMGTCCRRGHRCARPDRIRRRARGGVHGRRVHDAAFSDHSVAPPRLNW